MPTMLHTCGPRKPSSRGVGSMPSSIGCSARFLVAIDTLDLESTPGHAEVQGRSYGCVRLVPGDPRVKASALASRRQPSPSALAGGEVLGAHLVEELPELLDLLFVLVLLEEHAGLLQHLLVGEDGHRVA